MDEIEFFEKRKSFTAVSGSLLDFNPTFESQPASPTHRQGTRYEDEYDPEDADDDADDYFCTVIFNGNAVLHNQPSQVGSPMTTIVSHRDGDKTVDMVKYLPGGFVTVESCCCDCDGSIPRSSRLTRRRPVLPRTDYDSGLGSCGNLKKIKGMSRSIYLPSPNATRRFTKSHTRPKSINLDDFERNSIVTISYYGDEADNTSQEDHEHLNQSSLEPTSFTNSYGDLNDHSASTNSTQVDLITDQQQRSAASPVKTEVRFDNNRSDSKQPAENKSHISGEFVFSSSAEDLVQSKEAEKIDPDKKSTSSIERSYVPYKPKHEGDTKINDFATEIIMKPKENILNSVSDVIMKASGLKNSVEEDLTEFDKLDEDERLKKIEEIARIKAAGFQPKIGLSVKMF